MNNNNQYTKSTLGNGLRVITVPTLSSRSVTLMVMVGTGSRYEEQRVNGISHFIEHMFFKGGEKYPTSFAASSAIDSVGGVFNAFTSVENVGYYVKLSSEEKKVAYDVLSDMLLKSRFESEEIEKERGVITEEIRMIQDKPMSLVHLDFKEHFFGNQPLGWKITGPEETIESITREDLLNYRKMYYSANNCVLVAAGNITHQENINLANEFFKFEEQREKMVAKPYKQISPPRSKLREKKIEQAHFIIHFPVPGDQAHVQPSLKILTHVLGGTSSSRLFNEIRERRGLAYYIHSGLTLYTDVGALTVSGGLNTDNLDEGIRCVVSELSKISSNGITNEEFLRARGSIKGRRDLTFEDSMNLASLYAIYESLYGKIKTPDDIAAELEAVTLEEVNNAAKSYICKERIKLTLLGPFSSIDQFDKELDSW